MKIVYSGSYTSLEHQLQIYEQCLVELEKVGIEGHVIEFINRPESIDMDLNLKPYNDISYDNPGYCGWFNYNEIEIYLHAIYNRTGEFWKTSYTGGD